MPTNEIRREMITRIDHLLEEVQQEQSNNVSGTELTWQLEESINDCARKLGLKVLPFSREIEGPYPAQRKSWVTVFDPISGISHSYWSGWEKLGTLTNSGNAAEFRQDLLKYLKRWRLFIDTLVIKDESDRLDENRSQPAEDDDDYVAAKDCLGDEAKSHKKLITILKKHPEIRRRKPTKQRLEVHAGDWLRHKQKKAEAQWQAADAQAIVEAVSERTAQIRKQKARTSTSPATSLLDKIAKQNPR